MMAEEYKVDGLRALSATLAGLPAQLEKRMILGALRAAAQVIRKDAMQRVPILKKSDPRRRAGLVRDSITVRKSKVRNNAVYVGVSALKASQVKITKGAKKTIINKRGREQVVATRSKRDWSNPDDPAYWKFIEFGSSTHHARPFLRPAFEAKKLDAIERFKIYMSRRIVKESEKLARQQGMR